MSSFRKKGSRPFGTPFFLDEKQPFSESALFPRKKMSHLGGDCEGTVRDMNLEKRDKS